MRIGIDGSRAFLARRTGIEEYAYQLISHLREPLRDERVVLYTRMTIRFEGWRPRIHRQKIDFDVPASWQVRPLFAPRFFTHGRLSLEMVLRRPERLLIPAHTVPFIHPKHTLVVVHGLEYEFSKHSYSLWDRIYMRSVIRFSVQVAERIVAVSENTKRDLMRLYGVPERKISVVYEGKPDIRSRTTESILNFEFRISKREPKTRRTGKEPYLLFVGRIEERKNVRGIIEAFDILKARRSIPHRLILVGKPGYGYGEIRRTIDASSFRGDIVEKGYIGVAEKEELLRGADVFVFPSLYEGFGLPVVEAQTAGVPVVTSDTSSLPEVAGTGAVLVDPSSSDSIASGIWRILSDSGFRDDIIEKGRENTERFDWSRCAAKISALLKGEEQDGIVRIEPKNQRAI